MPVQEISAHKSYCTGMWVHGMGVHVEWSLGLTNPLCACAKQTKGGHILFYSDVDILVHVKLNCQVTNVAIQASFITFISHPESSSWKTSLWRFSPQPSYRARKRIPVMIPAAVKLNFPLLHWLFLKGAFSPIIPCGPKCCSRHFIIHRLYVDFELSVLIQAIDCFLAS